MKFPISKVCAALINMQMSRSIVISPNEIAHLRFAGPPAQSQVFSAFVHWSFSHLYCALKVLRWSIHSELIVGSLCVAALLLHLLHGGDGRNEPRGTRAHR
jgi:hypothetical protein